MVMRFGIDVPNFGDFADPTVVAGRARRAEDAGWDGLFVWDHVTHRKELHREIADPWVLLTAAALATRRIRLGTMITPVARRRVSKLAREVTTLDRLTGGRMILGVGLGAPLDDEFGSFGETTDARELAAHLDEGLTVLSLLRATGRRAARPPARRRRRPASKRLRWSRRQPRAVIPPLILPLLPANFFRTDTAASPRPPLRYPS
jgi:alkanesulfonate monooxygenase SsuD/methylene tetrahydromethanopterin reductase-like flavin-dependent oxidoreductase (luciferase family)